MALIPFMLRWRKSHGHMACQQDSNNVGNSLDPDLEPPILNPHPNVKFFQGFLAVEALQQHLAGDHHRLIACEKYTRPLDHLAAELAEHRLRLTINAVLT